MRSIFSNRTPGGGRGLARYVATWVVAGVLVVAAVAVLGPEDRSDPAGLPPVRETELTRAVRAAGCEIRTDRGPDALNPPVDGPRGAAAEPGVYDPPPAPDEIVGALRRGLIVIHYRRGIDEQLVHTLEAVQGAVPEGTIVAPNATRMPYEVAATSWRRLLGCARFSERSLDAVRLFRGRFIGRGPDE